MSEDAGLVNVYVCKECGAHTVTKNRDEGTTPFAISCRATEGCTGEAFSSFYRVSQKLQPDLLWIKPTPEELTAFLEEHANTKGTALEQIHRRDAIRRHVAMGGLLDIRLPEKGLDVHGVVVNGDRAVHFDLGLGKDVTVARCSCGWHGDSLAALRAHVEEKHEPLTGAETKP